MNPTTLKRLVLLVIVLVMLNNIEHLATVHYGLSQKIFPVMNPDWINRSFSFFVVAIFEFVIIVLVMMGRHAYAGFFTFCIFVLSMIYYDIPSMFNGEDVTLSLSKGLAATIYSTVFTISIYMFSRIMADFFESEDILKKLRDRIHQLESTFKQSQSTIDQQSATINQQATRIIELQASLKETATQLHQLQAADTQRQKKLQCPYCHQQQKDEGSLRAHKGHCTAKSKEVTLAPKQV